MIACKPAQKGYIFNWKMAAELPPEEGKDRSIGYAGPVAGMHSGILFIGGGANFPDGMPWLGGKKKYHDELWVYRPAENKFELFRLPYTLAYSANVSTPVGLISIGGENETGIVAGVLLIQWKDGEPVITKLPSLPVAVTNASATIVGNEIFVAGGETKDAASDKFFRLNYSDFINGWQELAPLPQATSHSVLIAAGKDSEARIYLMGGRKKNISGISDLYATTFEYNITANSWQQKKSLPYAICAGTGAFSGNDYIVLFGGDKGETFHKTEMIITKINAEKDATVKDQLNREKVRIQSTHPGFSKEILWYNIKTNEWKTSGFVPFDVPVTTTAVTIGDKIFIPTGEIRAGVRTPQILEAASQ